MMKNIHFYIGILVLLFGVSACNGSNDGSATVIYPEEEEDLYNFEAFSLSAYGVNALIYLPDETASIGTSTEPEVHHELNHYIWDIIVGSNFHIVIEDWGDSAFSEYVDEIDTQNIYDIEYLEKEDNFIYYKATLKVKGQSDKDNVGVNHESYHVAAMHTIDGINYIFKSNKDGHDKLTTDYMAKSVKNIKDLD